MIHGASEAQRAARAEYREFVEREIAPHAHRYDADESIPGELVRKLAAVGYLGSMIPQQFGGRHTDAITAGILHEEVGRGSASVQGLLNVHNMAAQSVLRWGSRAQRDAWIPRFASGDWLAGFAVTEPTVGSDAAKVETTARSVGDRYLVNGQKKWITCGQVADVFLVLTRCDDQPAALLVPRHSSGLSIRPISGMLGCRGYMLATLDFADCEVPKENLVGRLGFGMSHVVAHGLDVGRYCLAWGCVGSAQACLDASIRYTAGRHQFGASLKEHQLIQQMVTRMVTKIAAARQLCFHAGCLRDGRHPDAILETLVAKYFASKALNEIANDAVQIHGANGCSSDYPVERYLRDAKIMEIIEGTSQMHELMIAQYAYQSCESWERRSFAPSDPPYARQGAAR
jgi:glutaryl-CoA dehydrogenase (non-decarboxylating)